MLPSLSDAYDPNSANDCVAGRPNCVNITIREMGRRFDGTNEAQVRKWFIATYGVVPVPGAEQFFGAYLSDAECAVIRSGLHDVEREYVADAVDEQRVLAVA